MEYSKTSNPTKKKPGFSSGPRTLTPQDIESLQKSRQETSKANLEYFKKLGK